jgi:hypothetical protein
VAERFSALPERLLDLLAARGLDPQHAWLTASLARSTEDPELRVLRGAIAQAPRKLGRGPLSLHPSERDAHDLPELLGAAAWTLADLGRTALLLAAVERVAVAEQVELVAKLVRHGELGEQASLLRAFSLLPEPSRFVDIAIDACRTNAVDVFSAIALDNPYPAALFPEHNFNQMVLKALFIGAPVERIVGLERRASPELERMVFAYASERRAAGRSVPADVEIVTRLCSSSSLRPRPEPGALPTKLCHTDS